MTATPLTGSDEITIGPDEVVVDPGAVIVGADLVLIDPAECLCQRAFDGSHA